LINVEACLDWKAGDSLVISSTESTFADNEVVTIKSVDGNVIALNENIKNFHYGSPNVLNYTIGKVDMRASVGLLTRNIVIKSSNSW